MAKYYSISNNSKTIQDRAIPRMADQKEIAYVYQTALFLITLNDP